MKTDLATSIVVAVVGVIAAYFVCNLFIGPLESFSFSTLDPTSNVSAEVEQPNPEIFNYRALNSTVEVYVGDCQEFVDGECVDGTNDQNKGEGQ